MKRSKFTEEQVTYVLRQAESGTAVEDICRSMGISQATFYIWKKKLGELGASEVRRLRQLKEENLRLKKLVADLILDESILQEVIKKKI
jgi:putative transposase